LKDNIYNHTKPRAKVSRGEKIKIMEKTLNRIDQSKNIFWNGKLVKFVKWESMNFGGKLKIKIDKRFFEVDISELSN